MADILLWMLALPLALLLLIWLFAQGRKAAKARAEAAAAAPAIVATSPAAPSPDEALRGLHWHILASAQHSALGTSRHEALGNIIDPEKTPNPDSHFTDSEGLPVFTGRCELLDDEALEQTRSALEEHCATHNQHLPEWPDERLRAATLALPVLEQLAAMAFSHPGLAAPPAAEGLDAQAAISGQGAAQGLPMLRVSLLLPLGWPEAERQQLGDFLRGRLEQLAAEAQWPAERLAMTVQAAAQGSETLLQLDRQLLAVHREQRPELCLLLAAESLLGEPTIAAWEDNNWLRSASQPNGGVPGEAAAGLLLALPAVAKAYGLEAPVQLHRAALAVREKPVTASGRSSALPVKLLAEQALAAAQATAAAVCAVVSDAEAKPAYAAELGLLVTEMLPELDAVANVHLVGSITGAAGVAATLAGLGIAQAQAEKQARPVLFVASADARERAVLVLQLPPQPVAPAAA